MMKRHALFFGNKDFKQIKMIYNGLYLCHSSRFWIPDDEN